VAHRLLVAPLVLIALACAGVRSARPIAADFPEPHSDEELDQRLHFLEARLDAGRLHAAAWSWGWLGIEGLGGVNEIVSATRESESSDRARNIVDAVKSSVGVADIVVLRPMPGRSGAAPLRALPGATFAEKRAQLVRGEAILLAAAARAEERLSWQSHLGNLAFNLAGSAVLLGLGHRDAAWVSLATGAAGGELEIWSEPWRAPRDLEDYRKLVAAGVALASDPPVRWHGAFTGTGLALQLQF